MSRWTVFAVLVFTGLFGSLTATAGLVGLTAAIDGAQANAGAGTGSAASATAAMTYDTETMALSWTIGEVTPYFDSSLRFAHFHGPAGPSANAGVQLWICSNVPAPVATAACGGPGEAFASGMATLTSAQAIDLLAGRWYINLHTDAFPAGEIRGNISRVPEPWGFSLLGAGLLCLFLLRRRQVR